MRRRLFSLKDFHFLLFVAFLIFMSLESSFAQNADSSDSCAVVPNASRVTLSGTVSDPSGAILHDASVTITCGALKLQATTDVTGSYAIEIIPGTYHLSVGAKGFSANEEILEVSAGADNKRDLILNVAQNRSTVEVRAGGDGYDITESSEATRTDTAIRDIPQAVYVIPQQVLQDEQVVRLADVVRNVSGG